MCKVYTGYCGTSEIEHGLCASTVNNPLAKARGLSLRTGAQPMLYLPLVLKQFVIKPMVIILIIMVGPESSMLHKSFKVIGLFVSEEKIFLKSFTIWQW